MEKWFATQSHYYARFLYLRVFETSGTPTDAELIADHRQHVCPRWDMGMESLQGMMRTSFLGAGKTADGRYVGWLVDGNDQHVVAGAGMWLMDFPPLA